MRELCRYVNNICYTVVTSTILEQPFQERSILELPFLEKE
jgi:hypothetical protein